MIHLIQAGRQKLIPAHGSWAAHWKDDPNEILNVNVERTMRACAAGGTGKVAAERGAVRGRRRARRRK